MMRMMLRIDEDGDMDDYDDDYDDDWYKYN